jgi:hypothetical protein
MSGDSSRIALLSGRLSEADDQIRRRHELGELGALLEGRIVEGVLIDEFPPDEDVLLEEVGPAEAAAIPQQIYMGVGQRF